MRPSFRGVVVGARGADDPVGRGGDVVHKAAAVTGLQGEQHGTGETCGHVGQLVVPQGPPPQVDAGVPPGLLIAVVGDEDEKLIVGGEDTGQVVKGGLDPGEGAGASRVRNAIAIEVGRRVRIDRILLRANVAVIGRVGTIGNERDDVVGGEAILVLQSAVDVGRVFPIARPVVEGVGAAREDHGIAVLSRTLQVEGETLRGNGRRGLECLRGIADRVRDNQGKAYARLIGLGQVKELQNRPLVLDGKRGKIGRKKDIAAGMLPTRSGMVVHKKQPARWPGRRNRPVPVAQRERGGGGEIGAA